MKTFNVFISLESFKDGFGEIFIKLDDYVFPGNKWTDFSENLLSWWTEEFTKLLTNEKSKVKCGFMDGAVRFDIKVIDRNLWQIQFIREYADSEVCEYETQIEAYQAVESLLQAINKMLSYFSEKNCKKSFDFLNQRKQMLVSSQQNISHYR